MIKELTTEQWQRVHEARDKWMAIGTCTDPADRETTERALSELYNHIGRKPPKFVWCSGPKACELSYQHWRKLGNDQCRQLPGPFTNQLSGNLIFKVLKQLETQLEDRLRDQLVDQCLSAIIGLFRGDILWGSLTKILSDKLLASNENIYWAGHYIICRDIVGIRFTAEENKILDLYAEIAKSSGWIFPFEGICLISERHKTIRFDDDYRLHCEDGPAVVYRDGCELHAWRGTRVPKEWIEDKESIDPSVALTWENIEQRRAAAEIIGWEKVLDQLPNRIIDSNIDPQIGELIEVDLPDTEGLLDATSSRFLRAQCGTGRMVTLPVPIECSTALEANAWTYDVHPETLKKLEIRT